MNLFKLTLLTPLLCLSAIFSTAAQDAEVSFNKDIRPIFINKCTKCHGGAKADGDLSLIYRSEVLGTGKSGKTIIVPGKPEQSELYRRITTNDLDDKMPLQKGDHADDPLTQKQCDTIKQWILQGAKWQDHWAYAKPTNLPIPKLKHPSWPTSTMDKYVLANIEKHNLAPAKPASRAQWLRRASLDLIGLPPTNTELQNFLANSSPNAFATEVDRLLASPHYGERWASVWMDLARYADTQGYEKDRHRNAWPYRDYLIHAFNSDKPYDSFIQQQLAGDLFPNPTTESLTATAFHRNTQTNDEGGTDDEEYRVMATIDRVSTTWLTFQGLTFGCIQCHAHPYEPIPHSAYYNFTAYFNSTADADIGNDYPLFKVAKDPKNRIQAVNLFLEKPKLLERLNNLGKGLITSDTSWKKITFASTKTTHGKLTQYPNSELRVSGTLAVHTRFDLTSSTNNNSPPQNITALRVSIIPEEENPAALPERGSVLSQLILKRIDAKGVKHNIPLRHVFADSTVGPYRATDSLRPSSSGFGGYPKLFKTRQAVIIPRQPVTLHHGESLAITIENKAGTTGNQACTLRRFTIETSTNPQWTKIASSDKLKHLTKKLTATISNYNKIEGTSLPIIQQRPEDAQRETRLFIGGLWLNKGKIHHTAIPDLLNPNGIKANDRLSMAKWISSEENPLTARVMVNRLFAELFGRGIVHTLGDFGSTGTKPTNLPLLDHLAIEFQTTQQWSIKQALRNMVLSATYRQDNHATPQLAQEDPLNIILARGPRTRLNAEMIRDNALLTSGLLSAKIAGPSVMPPQPNGIWQTVYNGGQWKTSTGADRYRRALYTYWKRTSPYPSMLTFDVPTRDICTPQRIPTNTPLHALVTLNDPVFLECSTALATKIRKLSPDDIRKAIAIGYTITSQQKPSDSTLDILIKLHSDYLAEFTKHPEQSKKIADTPALAALTVLANTLLNLDVALTK